MKRLQNSIKNLQVKTRAFKKKFHPFLLQHIT